MLLGNAAEELGALSSKAADLLNHAQTGRLDAACVRSCDLVHGVSRAKSRWAKSLPLATRQNLNTVTEHLAIIARVLAQRKEVTAPLEVERLVTYCHRIVVDLGAESGKILAIVERKKADNER